MNKQLDEIDEFDLKNVPKFSLDGHSTLARFCQIYDGDTCKAIFPFQGKLYKWSCRLTGIDTPELRTKDPLEKEAAKLAKDALVNLLQGKTLRIFCHEFDKYGRLLINIVTDDDEDVTQNLIKRGFGRSYDGGHKKPWNFPKNPEL